LINLGETTLAFIDIKRNKPCLPPADFQEKLKKHFN
jgi:acyl-CoA thioester hydrolase